MAKSKSESTSDLEALRDAADAIGTVMQETEELVHKGSKIKLSENQHYDQEIR